jgi:hypothetical protein
MLNNKTCLIFSDPTLPESAAIAVIDDANATAAVAPAKINLFVFM